MADRVKLGGVVAGAAMLSAVATVVGRALEWSRIDVVDVDAVTYPLAAIADEAVVLLPLEAAIVAAAWRFGGQQGWWRRAAQAAMVAAAAQGIASVSTALDLVRGTGIAVGMDGSLRAVQVSSAVALCVQALAAGLVVALVVAGRRGDRRSLVSP